MELLNDARRLAGIGTFFVIVGWVGFVYALIAGALWWLDLATSEAFNILEAFAISGSAVAGPIFGALIVGGIGYFMRLFALYVASRAQ